MKLELDKPFYPYPHPVKEAVIRGRIKGRDIFLREVSMKEMEAAKNACPHLRGMPTMYAVDEHDKKIWVHPNPNGEYELDVTRGINGTISLGKKAAKA
jgi:hypothetical protein